MRRQCLRASGRWFICRPKGRSQEHEQLSLRCPGTPVRGGPAAGGTGTGRCSGSGDPGWSEVTGETVSQRTKEQAHDYRYFPEPDLPPLAITEARLDEIRTSIGELPAARRARYMRDLALPEADAALLAGDDDLARYFEATMAGDSSPAHAKTVSNWILNDILGLQKSRSLGTNQFPVPAQVLRELIELVASGKITGRAAKQVLPEVGGGETATATAERLSLLSMDDQDVVRSAARSAMTAFPAAVEDFRGGKTAAIGRLIGETIKLTGGRAKPDDVRAILLEELSD